MRRGGFGKRKGSGFEREICKILSLWVSGGHKEDVFWRSAMSGGRATVHHRKGTAIRQAGDICAVAPEGHEFSEAWFVECKNIRDMRLSSFLLSDTGPLAKFWRVAQREANIHGREPMLIVRSRGPIVVLTPSRPGRDKLSARPLLTAHARGCQLIALTDLVAAPWRTI